jgi:esterase/lipase
MVSGDKPIGKRIDITKTVTILVHGYRGNEFDLSKLKSYLNLFLGFTHFYAVRSIGPGEGTDAGINKLGELAGEEVNKYLSANIGIKYVNVVGFSLGGVIARSMLPHLTAHQHKFNLLLTLASPHLGIIEVSSCLVRTGLFYMRRVAKVESIQDLNNERTTDRSRYLQELANCPLITAFRWVILVGSN